MGGFGGDGAGMGGDGGLGGFRSGRGGSSDDFLELADREALRDGPIGQSILPRGISNSRENLGMACGEQAAGDRDPGHQHLSLAFAGS